MSFRSIPRTKCQLMMRSWYLVSFKRAHLTIFLLPALPLGTSVRPPGKSSAEKSSSSVSNRFLCQLHRFRVSIAHFARTKWQDLCRNHDSLRSTPERFKLTLQRLEALDQGAEAHLYFSQPKQGWLMQADCSLNPQFLHCSLVQSMLCSGTAARAAYSALVWPGTRRTF